MARKLDRILVIDVEATCWEGNPPPGQTSEIIEIGLCMLDVPTLTRAEQRTIIVRPVCSRVSAYCTQLTTLTQADSEGRRPVSSSSRMLARSRSAVERSLAVSRRVFQVLPRSHAANSASISSLASGSTTGALGAGGAIVRTMLASTDPSSTPQLH